MCECSCIDPGMAPSLLLDNLLLVEDTNSPALFIRGLSAGNEPIVVHIPSSPRYQMYGSAKPSVSVSTFTLVMDVDVHAKFSSAVYLGMYCSRTRVAAQALQVCQQPLLSPARDRLTRTKALARLLSTYSSALAFAGSKAQRRVLSHSQSR